MKNCELCFVGNNKVKIFEGIYESRLINICERCSIIENVPIVRRPNTSQLKESELRIYDRMKRLSGLSRFSEQKPKKQDTFFVEDRLKQLEASPHLERPEESLNLMDHFHWEIMKQRRRKGLSHEQLAKNLGESVIVIQMLEKGKLPGNADVLIRKLEQFFQISLRKIDEREIIFREKFKKTKTEPILLDEKGQVLETIPEEEMIFIEDEESEKEKLSENEFDLKKIDIKKVTIADLKKFHRRKIEVTKKEQVEEQKRIEERKSQLEALREKDRTEKEKIRF